MTEDLYHSHVCTVNIKLHPVKIISGNRETESESEAKRIWIRTESDVTLGVYSSRWFNYILS